jgi:hypothetical protein
MKEAKTEAEQIISAYRAEMEASYKSKLASVSVPLNPIIILLVLVFLTCHPHATPTLSYIQQTGASGSVGDALQSNTSNEISSMTRDFSAKRGGVEQMLIDLVLKVEPKAPEARTA